MSFDPDDDDPGWTPAKPTRQRGIIRSAQIALEDVTLRRIWRVVVGHKAARRRWAQHLGEVGAPHPFAGCAPCEMAKALGFTRQR